MSNQSSNSPEKILVIPRSEFEDRNPFEGFVLVGPDRQDLSEYLQSDPGKIASFIDRDLVEEDENWLQIIPYITFISNESVLTYRRAGSEKRLDGKVSIGIGGHVNIDDDPDHPFLAFLQGAAREIKEEVGMDMPLDPLKDRIAGLIYDPSNPVGRVHLGVSIIIRVPEDIAQRMINDAADDMHAPAWVPIKDFSATFATDPVETWSRFVFSEILRSQSTEGKWSKKDFRERANMLAVTAANLASAASGMAMQETSLGYEASRDLVEQAAGNVQAMLAGVTQRKDIREDKIKSSAKEFLAELPTIMRHQTFSQQ